MAGSGRLSREWECDRAVLLPHHSSPFGWISLGTLASLAVLFGLLSPDTNLSGMAQLIAP
jgi:hypothetical protein